MTRINDSIAHLKQSIEFLSIDERQIDNVINNVWDAAKQSRSWASDIMVAFMHLSQSFNSGHMRSEEYRSVAETIPSLVDAIANQLAKVNDITLEEAKISMRKFVDKGEVTREVMIAAFENMKND